MEGKHDMTGDTNIGVWNLVQAEDDRVTNSVTEAMNVSGGCIVRTKTKDGGVAQTLLLNMRCVKAEGNSPLSFYQLEPGVIIP